MNNHDSIFAGSWFSEDIQCLLLNLIHKMALSTQLLMQLMQLMVLMQLLLTHRKNRCKKEHGDVAVP